MYVNRQSDRASTQATAPLEQQIVLKSFTSIQEDDVKKDRREAESCEASMWTGVSTGDKNVIPLDVARVPNSNNLTTVPQADLPAGEYLLIADQSKGYDGYDFGVK